MGFRVVVVSSHSKLELSLNYLVFKTIDEIKRISLNEIQTLIIESTAVAITSALLVELMKKKIKVIFCDEKKNPISELIPYYGDSISYRRITQQIQWTEIIKNKTWKEIIKEKIKNQANSLRVINEDGAKYLETFAEEVDDGDLTNREGHAAKYYFNRIFGNDFVRNNSDPKNTYLNYGYALLLSQVNRCVVMKGYLTQLGIHHKNEFNQFNFSCDLMEPLRPFVDSKVLKLNEANYKEELVKILTEQFIIDNKKQTLSNAIYIYVSSVFNALNTESIDCIKFVKEIYE